MSDPDPGAVQTVPFGLVFGWCDHSDKTSYTPSSFLATVASVVAMESEQQKHDLAHMWPSVNNFFHAGELRFEHK